MTWDFEYTDEQTETSYRIRAKTFSVRDGLACSNAQDAIIREYEGRELLELSNYPVLKYGTDTAEFTVDGKLWAAIPIATPDDYLNLPEFVAYGWQQAIFRRNPQRWDGYEKLKNSLAALGHPTNTPPTSENANGANETPLESLNV
jgi:hypothetical protein